MPYTPAIVSRLKQISCEIKESLTAAYLLVVLLWPDLMTPILMTSFAPPCTHGGWIDHSTCLSEVSEYLANTSYPQDDTQTPSDW